MKAHHVVILLVLLAAILVVAFPKGPVQVSESDAKNFVLEDARTKYPKADDIEILSIVQNSTTQQGAKSYNIKASVVIGAKSVCPERYHFYYDYPSSNFVTWKETIVKNCKVCSASSKCPIAFPEEAIIASHTFDGMKRIADFIKDYPDAKPAAKYYESYAQYQNVWLVRWASDSSPVDMIGIISNKGAAVDVISEEKQAAQ
ncbi:hypothetical protein FJZ26_00665 [Candidatus Parvarchaeota archaeon]|nr:hypothetical protein [Candidatus Parvarchaeota archaeon]